MALHQYDIPRSAQMKTNDAVRTTGSSIGTSAVRVTIDDSIAGSKFGALQALDVIKQKIASGLWPPA